jgi:nucleotide-binding universal stress UspA family protein
MEERSPFTHILVPTDGSENSIHAGRLAIRVAAAYRARVTLVYVVTEDSAIVGKIAAASSKTLEVTRRELEDKGHRYLDYLSRLAQERNVQFETAIRYGVPHNEIARLARERKADLIVIGRVGSHGLRGARIGSVAERVIEYAPCPVLVVSQTVARVRG